MDGDNEDEAQKAAAPKKNASKPAGETKGRKRSRVADDDQVNAAGPTERVMHRGMMRCLELNALAIVASYGRLGHGRGRAALQEAACTRC
jgi:hypothetical protein